VEGDRMKLPPEADPSFWVGAKCVRVRVSHFVSGAIERIITVVSTAGVKTQIADNSHQSTSAFSMQTHALALAKVSRKRGATDAMRQVFPQIAQVEQKVAALLPAAEQRGIAVFRRRKARDDLRTNTRRRERVLEDIRRNAELFSEEELVTAWREGVVEGVHVR
jgi:hypothetical protein